MNLCSPHWIHRYHQPGKLPKQMKKLKCWVTRSLIALWINASDIHSLLQIMQTNVLQQAAKACKSTHDLIQVNSAIPTLIENNLRPTQENIQGLTTGDLKLGRPIDRPSKKKKSLIMLTCDNAENDSTWSRHVDLGTHHLH
jgi:hypothetical protein